MAKVQRQICGDAIMEGSNAREEERVGLDGRKTRRLIIEGVAIECDIPGINGRSYPKRIIEREVKRLVAEAVPYGRLAAELNHPRLDDEGSAKDYPIFEMNLAKTCAVVEDLHMEGNKLMCRMVVAEGTPAGDTLAGLIRSGYRPGYSLRGAGNTIPAGDHEEIDDDYTMITIDVVGNPSFGKTAIFNSRLESVNGGKRALTESVSYNPSAIMESLNSYRREVAAATPFKIGYEKYNKAAMLAEMVRGV
ncbi:MAG: hypothetical protein MJZ25_04055 [Fibrobacter sp.]|nr:hypothetical protein [Fibrobacter sp.]